MTALASTAFLATVANALERMAFVMVEPADEAPQQVLAGSGFCARVQLQHEAAHGVVLVAATDGFLQEFVANMLGAEPQAIGLHEHGEIAVKELANVLAGEAVMAAGGADSPLRLGLPEALDAAGGASQLTAIETAAGGFCCVLASDCGRLLVAGSLP